MRKKHFHIPIFVFEDYVEYLQAWYTYTKRFGYTQRLFLQEAGIKAQAFLSDILSRRKGIGKSHIEGFVRALELTDDAAHYFELLVQKTICKKPQQKEPILKELAQLRKKNLSAVLENRNLEYFASWMYPVIREFIAMKGFISSPKEIVNSLINLKLSSRDVEGALKKLQKWNMIIYNEELGRYSINEAEGVITYKNLPHVVVNDVKRTLIEASIHAMETMPSDQRHVSMAIRGVSDQEYEKLCKKIDALRLEFLDGSNGDEGSDKVLALTIQAFPVIVKKSDLDKGGDGDEADE